MRQYIGARYVPKFMGTYDNTQSYEALCVVDNGMGTSYISIKPTPPGTLLTDTTYWAVYGASSGAIIDLQNQMRNVKAGGDLIIIAASYGITPSATDNFIVYLKQLLDGVYDNIYDNSIGAASFGNGAYLSALQAITVDDATAVKDIIVVGHQNDYATPEADLVTAMTTFRQYCNTTYPNAKVSLAPVSSRGFPVESNPGFTCYNTMVNHIADHGISIMTDIYQILMLDWKTYLQSDRAHPTTAGAKLLAEAIYNMLVNGCFTKIVSNMEPSANHTFNANITPKSAPYPFVDFVSLDNHRIDFNMIMSFDVVNDDYIPTARGIFQLCDGNSLLNGPEPTNYTFMKRFEGFMTKIGTNETWPVAIDIIYDNGFYCYYVTNLRADNLILTAGDEWTLKCHGSYPFYLN